MRYLSLVNIYQQLEKTAKRLEKTAIIAQFLAPVPAEELSSLIMLLQGRVFSQWDSRDIGFSARLMIKALEKATGSSAKNIETLWTKTGDLGKVAADLVKKKTQATLTTEELSVKKVITNLQKLETVEGIGAVERKISLVAELITSATPEEARFIVRTVLGELRVGIATGIVRDAISQAFYQNNAAVENAFDLIGDYGEAAVHAKNGTLGSVSLKPGRPVNAMLSILVQNVGEALEALGKPAQFEPKLDGFRLQIHKHHEKILLFTRRLENVTKQFPDIAANILSHVQGDDFILDAEAVGFDPKTGKHLPFQHISQRIKRKYDIAMMAQKLPVEINVFDVLYYNHTNMMDKPLQERRALLETIVTNEPRKVRVTEALITADEQHAEQFFKTCLQAGNEGVMIKNRTMRYRPGRYVDGWCKLKQTLEPLDLVIVAATWGEGKRAKWLSSFTVACRSHGQFLEVGRVSTGLKEKEEEGVTFQKLTKLLKPSILDHKGREVTVKPQIVVEVAYEEIQKSPTYSSGYAMRFPRILRLRIDEKTTEDINTLADIERIAAAQRK